MEASLTDKEKRVVQVSMTTRLKDGGGCKGTPVIFEAELLVTQHHSVFRMMTGSLQPLQLQSI